MKFKTKKRNENRKTPVTENRITDENKFKEKTINNASLKKLTITFYKKKIVTNSIQFAFDEQSSEGSLIAELENHFRDNQKLQEKLYALLSKKDSILFQGYTDPTITNTHVEIQTSPKQDDQLPLASIKITHARESSAGKNTATFTSRFELTSSEGAGPLPETQINCVLKEHLEQIFDEKLNRLVSNNPDNIPPAANNENPNDLAPNNPDNTPPAANNENPKVKFFDISLYDETHTRDSKTKTYWFKNIFENFSLFGKKKPFNKKKSSEPELIKDKKSKISFSGVFFQDPVSPKKITTTSNVKESPKKSIFARITGFLYR